MLLLNLSLAIAWTVFSGRLSGSNFLIGFAVGYMLLWLLQRAVGPTAYFRKTGQLVGLALFFLVELFRANLRVAYEVITPSHYMKPAIVAIPLDLKSDAAITLLADLITLTPGTLSIDVSTDQKVLYVHAMYVSDVAEFRRDIKEGFERRIKEVFE
jgi:multicomponent Na+:H+ antiporter subunit E